MTTATSRARAAAMRLHEATFTTVDVCRALDVEPEPPLTWHIGRAAQRMYRLQFGTEPPKALRPKTRGPGSHAFAVYPMRFWPTVQSIIEREQAARVRQLELPL